MLSVFSSSFLGCFGFWGFFFLGCRVGFFFFLNTPVLWNSRMACMCFLEVYRALSSMVVWFFASLQTLYNCSVLSLFIIYFRLVVVTILKYKFGSIYVSWMKNKIELKSDPRFFILPPTWIIFVCFCDILHLILVSLKTSVNFQSEILNVVY